MIKRISHNVLHIPTAPVFFLVAACIVFLPPALNAQFLTLPVDLGYLSQRADVIVQGSVTEVSYESHPDYPNLPTVKVTLEVENMLRGPSGRTYTFREILIGVKEKHEKRGYQVGQRLLLFLPAPSKYGLSSPVGIEQGRFHIARVSPGKETVANELGNAGLFKNVRKTAYSAGMDLSQKHLSMIAAKPGPVPLDEFVSLVKTLTLLPRIK